ncbi:AGAP001169-PB [Anopheles gambiae str. PEST]|uniref:Gustatory receptor n=1 Tax=Anopheles gambiae TaxID=7165 RepID=Q7PKI2_ANOGA|nr:AGAP001169-PB [Anopheles gambiae str. PEST]
MLYGYLTLLVLRLHFHTAQCIGFVPLHFNKQLQTFQISRWLTVWSHALALTLLCVYPYVYVILLTGIRYPKLTLVNYLVWMQCSLHYVNLALIYYHLLPARPVIRNIFNGFVQLFRTLNGAGCHRWKGKSTKKNVLKLALKMILCDTLLCALFVLYFGQFFIQDGDIQSQILWTLNIFSVWQSAIFTNLIVVTLIIGVHFLEILNHRLTLYIRQMRAPACHLKQLRRQISTYEALKSVQRNHHLVSSNVKSFIHLQRSTDTVSNKLIVISFRYNAPTQIFYAYTSIVQDIKNDVDVPLGTYMSSILFAVFEAVQFYYIVSASSEITEEVRKHAEKTGVLLNEFLPTDPNPRVERCIESFAIELLHEDFKINNCGMYDVDYTLMFSMIATITSYLIMLVQFQLAEI